MYRPRSEDLAVQATNDDASSAKLSAVSLGYWEDPYLKHFMKKTDRKIPLIHRGYYARTKGVQSLLRQFLDLPCEQDKQAIILGAGFDTSYWLFSLALQNIHWFELDFEAVTMRKASAIHRNAPLKEGLLKSEVAAGETPTYKNDGMQVHTSRYHLLPCDLRNWDEAVAKLQNHGFDKERPTLVLSECVLIYLPPDDAERIVSWCGTLSRCLFVNYEQILPDDAFGATMLSNLELRKCPLLGIFAVPDADAQRQRFLRRGFDTAACLDMNEVYELVAQGEERTRVEKIEWFDELEEWRIMLAHYCISWGVKSLPVAFSIGAGAGHN